MDFDIFLDFLFFVWEMERIGERDWEVNFLSFFLNRD